MFDFEEYIRPTRSVVGGCLLVFFGLMALVYAGLSGYAAWLASGTDKLAEAERTSAVMKYAGWSAGTLILGCALNVFGFRLVMNIEDYDRDDPEEPRLKF